jgi:subtilisin family serine protease
LKAERTFLIERPVFTRKPELACCRGAAAFGAQAGKAARECGWCPRSALALALVVTATAGPAQRADHLNPPAAPLAARADRILVKPKPGADLTSLHTLLGVRVLRRFADIGNLRVLQLPEGKSAAEIIARCQQSGLVEYAEPDFIVQALLEPNDFRFWDGSLWSLRNTGIYGGVPGADIDGPLGWDTQNSASNVIVAVMDTGVRFTHEDLAANMWINSGESGRNAQGFDISTNGVDDDADGFIDDLHGINAILGTGVPLDDYGHGTHVAGIIGGVGDNSVGIVGVCWHVQIMACKFLDNTGHGSVSDAITCIDYARRKGAKIINSSWGDYAYNSSALQDAIRSARDAGVIFVAACGNDGSNNDQSPLYPASFRLDNIIAVAATTRTDSLATFSNYGPTNVHLAAPGDPIFSCWGPSNSAYQYFNGTSMAAPHVAGVCALVWAHYPTDNYQQVIHRVLSGAEPLPGLAGKCVTGGRLNLAGALAASPGVFANFTAMPSSGPVPLTVRFTNASSGNVSRWRWDFGDCTASSTNKNPTHVYTNAGSFTVTLTITDTNNMTNSKSRNLRVTAPSMAAYQFRLRGESNKTYRIEGSTNLLSWTALTTNEAGADGCVAFTDAQAGGFRQRFYRGLRLDPSAGPLAKREFQ